MLISLHNFPCLEQIQWFPHTFPMFFPCLVSKFRPFNGAFHAQSQGSAGAHWDDARPLPTGQAASTAAAGRGGGQTNSCEAAGREAGAVGLQKHVDG